MAAKPRGFTFIELMIVVAMIAILVTIAIPNLLSARMAANETAAIATLRTVASAQATFLQRARVDVDADGRGEYGGFLELSAAVAGRASGTAAPAVLSGAFRVLDANGEMAKSGYLFRVFLPDAAGAGVGEPQAGFTPAMVNADSCESVWCAYAWPVNYQQSGLHTFFVNQAGDVLASECADYSGAGKGPAPESAFRNAGTITGPTAVFATGRDGGYWRPAQ
jgi:prepilin-type N-terminal cleavage/methylation domain-containing protein